MSNYGNPPSDPYGQPGPSGQDPYGQPVNPYGAQSYDPAGYGGVPQGVTFAHWGKRVGAAVIDGLLGMLAQSLYIVGSIMAASSAELTTDPVTGEVTNTGGGASGLALALMGLGIIMGLAFFIWNSCIKQGRTGYSIGKGVMGIKLVKAETGQPIGAGMSFVRQLAHILDALPCYLGFLWPLWDSKRQTFADKVIGTYVIDQPKG
ncbi:RDD domain-containing protein [Nocardioides sp. CF8]|uniref:RDD family protein n=1 Tax=Nocardioides sp. CF8 TaxID=110319 RepID=UPI00032EFD4D|nr:RDD family protein [Nocardioides sp. CF8]EON22464.1 RDD domain-containing protein [Nocardioides sp. CF8]